MHHLNVSLEALVFLETAYALSALEVILVVPCNLLGLPVVVVLLGCLHHCLGVFIGLSVVSKLALGLIDRHADLALVDVDRASVSTDFLLERLLIGLLCLLGLLLATLLLFLLWLSLRFLLVLAAVAKALRVLSLPLLLFSLRLLPIVCPCRMLLLFLRHRLALLSLCAVLGHVTCVILMALKSGISPKLFVANFARRGLYVSGHFKMSRQSLRTTWKLLGTRSAHGMHLDIFLDLLLRWLLSNWLLLLRVLTHLGILRLHKLLLLSFRGLLLLVLILLLLSMLDLLLLSSVALLGKHVLDRNHHLLQANRLDLVLLGVLLFNMREEACLRVEVSLAADTFEEWLRVVCAIYILAVS